MALMQEAMGGQPEEGGGDISSFFKRTIVAAGEKALYDEQVGPQIEQLAMSGNTPMDGVAAALTALLSQIRNSLVESGKGVPTELLFVPDGPGEVLAGDIAELIGEDPSIAPEATQLAEQMMMDTDAQAQQGQEQPQSGMQQPQQQPQGILGGMQ